MRNRAGSFLVWPWILLLPAAAAAGPADNTFKVGEALHYDVRWFFITGGKATLSVASATQFNGQDCYQFTATANSDVVFFFTVHDKIFSYSTKDNFYPLHFEKHLHEGNYRKDSVTEFDLEKGVARCGNEEAQVQSGCRDLLGAFYFFRTLALPPPGKPISVCVHADNKNYELVVQVIRKEKIKVPAGEFQTVLIKPELKFEGLWQHKGDVYIWLTDDDSHVPVKIKSEIPILGSLNILLTGAELPK